MLKIRRSRNRLIFNMGILILVRRHLCIETASRICLNYFNSSLLNSMAANYHFLISCRGKAKYNNASWIPGPRLNKTENVITLRYQISSNVNHLVKCIFCGVCVKNFVWISQQLLWHSTRNFDTIHHKICISLAFIFVIHDIFELWRQKP